MNIQYIEKLKVLLLLTCVLIGTASCSKWDEFKDYIDEGEITYVGKVDSVKILSGNERIKIRALLKPDPKINEVRVFWNNMADSVSVPLTPAMKNSRLFEQILPMPEGVVSLVLVTYDDLGNKSVVVPVVGRSYGSRYQNGLSNRLVENAILNQGEVTIDWLDMDLAAGPFATEVKYLSNNGREKTIRVPLNAQQTKLLDISATTKTFSYRTLFLPQLTSVDTFYTSFKTLGISRDVTNEYLRNTRVPMTTIARSGRWGIPSDWTTNSAVRNHRSGSGEFFGGIDYEYGGPFLAMEAGWSSDNMVTIMNGKIFQTVTLPAGLYNFEMVIPDCTRGGRFYTVAAVGENIPNIEDIATSIAFASTNNPGTHVLNFTLTEEKKVSIGFVGILENKNDGGGTFWRINRVGLKQTLLVD